MSRLKLDDAEVDDSWPAQRIRMAENESAEDLPVEIYSIVGASFE